MPSASASAVADLQLRDGLLVRGIMEVEAQCVASTLQSLRASILTRFGLAGPRPLPAAALRPWGESYASAMSMAYLYGMRHADQLAAAQTGARIQLAGDRWDVPFAEAEEFLASLVVINKAEYRGLQAGIKFRAFTIAQVGDEDLMRRLQALYQAQASQGADRTALLQQVHGLLTQAGIGVERPYWLETHYRNNMMAAYAAGRWTQFQDNPLIAYLIYNSIMDDATTKLCRELDGTILTKDDPRWNSIYPPNHHSCRAVAGPLAQSQFERRGLRVSRLKLEILHADPSIAREHQFRANPAGVLDAVPAALAQRATAYGQWPAITRFAAKSSADYLAERTAAIRADQTLSAAIRTAVDGADTWVGPVPAPDGAVRLGLALVRQEGDDALSVVQAGLREGVSAPVRVARGRLEQMAAEGWTKLPRRASGRGADSGTGSRAKVTTHPVFSSAPGVTAQVLEAKLAELAGPRGAQVVDFLARRELKTACLTLAETLPGARAQRAIQDQVRAFLRPGPGAVDYVLPEKAPAGYTHPAWRHVVLRAPTTAQLADAQVEDLREAVQDLFRRWRQAQTLTGTAHRRALGWLVGESLTGAANLLVTWLHEVAHQVHYAAGTPPRPPGLPSLTLYGRQSAEEWHVEHWLAWFIDPAGLRAWDARVADYIEQLMARALQGPQ